MEALCQELGIPRKQIKKTKHPDRYIVIAHKSWLQCLITQNSVSPFHVHPGFDEWPNIEEIGQDWSLTYVMVNSCLFFDLNSILLTRKYFSCFFFSIDRPIKNSHTK